MYYDKKRGKQEKVPSQKNFILLFPTRPPYTVYQGLTDLIDFFFGRKLGKVKLKVCFFYFLLNFTRKIGIISGEWLEVVGSNT